MANGTLRSMVDYFSINQACEDKNVRPLSEGQHLEMKIYEAGMEAVLVEIATSTLRFHHEASGSLYKEDAVDSALMESMFKELLEVSPQKLKKRIDELETQAQRYSITSHDCGYIAGFLAGYRFLKEMR